MIYRPFREARMFARGLGLKPDCLARGLKVGRALMTFLLSRWSIHEQRMDGLGRLARYI